MPRLDIGRILRPQPRMPGYLTANRKTTVVRFTPSTPPSSAPSPSAPSHSTLSPSTSSPSTSLPLVPPVPYVLYVTLHSSNDPDTDSRMLGSCSSIEFRFAEAQGAALVTKHQTYRENIQAMGKFEKYAKKNHASWAQYARREGHGDVNPILVTGVDRTKDFAMMCYSDYDFGLECEFRTSASGTASASGWGTWKTTRPIYENHGPQLCHPLSTQSTSLASPSDRHAETPSDEYNQCVFIRYFRMPARKLWVSKMEAAAGPHNISTGGQDGEGSPLQAQYDSGSGSEISSSPFDGGRDSDMGSVTSIDSESDIVTHNPTTVRYLPPSHFAHSR